MGYSLKVTGLLFLVLAATGPSSPARADFRDGILQDAWSANALILELNMELSDLDVRKADSIKGYNDLAEKLSAYNGWCSTYGITALRNIVEGKLFLKMFTSGAYPAYYVYSNDPYFSGVRSKVDHALQGLHTVTSPLDVGKCLLTEAQLTLMKQDPRQFAGGSEDPAGVSEAYSVLAGSLRLIEQERDILLELRGRIDGSGTKNDSATVEQFIRSSYGALQEKIHQLRARTLDGYELSFRVPFGPLETYEGKVFGASENEALPNFFWIFERRAYYVNEARVAAGKFFETSVDTYTKADSMRDKFLAILKEADQRK